MEPREDTEQTPPTSEIGHVLGWLGRSADVEARPVGEILGRITETAARTLRVARVNVWLYDETRSALTCTEGYDARTGEHSSGEMLLASEHPSYFASLEILRHVSALDVHEDPRTRELDDYLKKHDIATILDVPMLRSGRVVGVVCHEHVGAPRSFHQSDRLFAGSVGDMVALALETSQRIELERERTRLRENMARMAQLNSLGWLAAGVAHDFRNLLMVIGANAEFLQQTLESSADQECARAITGAVGAASALCDQLQAYAGKGTTLQRPTAIGEAIAEAVSLFQCHLPGSVRFETDVDGALLASIDGVAVARAVSNLLVNALEAMPEAGGAIRLSVREAPPSAAALGHGFDFRTDSGRCALIEVVDTGIGIPSAMLARVSEPFFSTKARGSGFGLATVVGTVRAHRGLFHVESQPGRGSQFRIWLPLIAGAAPHQAVGR
jgi:two-component system, cell cycle sensor histidine kinase and response regulator CckA